MQRFFVAVLMLISLALPSTGFAESLSAGFAPSSIFVSQKKITAGTQVSIYTVLYNSSDVNFSGDVVFLIDGKEIGTQHVTLAAGEVQTPSVSWTGTQGTHTASARIEKIVGSDSGVTLAGSKTSTITVTVAPAPPPTPQTAAVSSASNIVSQGSSYVAPITNNAYDTLENFRKAAATELAQAAAKTTPKGTTLSTTAFTNPKAASTAAGGLLGTIWHFILQALLYVCNVKALFYIVLLVVIYLLFRVVMALFRGHRY